MATSTTTRRRPATKRSVTKAPAPGPGASHHEIARRSYELFQARGAGDGHDLDDWLQAERETGARGSEES
ncbi:MAG: DUF2934 domain-containing protein [Vicinamibacterales bacterium]|nr:DUF2934 domain-containing protein [Vicinamibacterales bacterium]